MDLSIIPECYVDTNLIETIVPPKRRGGQQGYNHQKGCGTVTSRMQKEFKDQFALGIIDKDKHQVDYLKEFTEVITIGSLILHKHRSRHHYIIQIYPAIERFMQQCAASVGVALADFGLPEDFDLLKKKSKNINSKEDPKFRELFKKLKKEGAVDVLRLAQWVEYLKETNYKADMEVLKVM